MKMNKRLLIPGAMLMLLGHSRLAGLGLLDFLPPGWRPWADIACFSVGVLLILRAVSPGAGKWRSAGVAAPLHASPRRPQAGAGA
jgi:hypothetical protein